MFIGLEDFDIDIFLRLDDENIDIYYTDFETLPQLANMVPLGSFTDGKLKLINLPMEDRIKIGLEFFRRDGFAEYKGNTFDTLIKVDAFLEQFGNIPEVVDFFEPYLQKCELPEPPEWCTKCENNECPEYCDNTYEYCSINIPVNEFYKIKGNPVLRFGASIPGHDFISNNNIVNITARINTIDSDGQIYTDEDTKLYDLNGLTLNNGNNIASNSSINITPLNTIKTGLPKITGDANELIGNKIELTIINILDSSKPHLNYITFYSNNIWEFQIPFEDELSDSKYKVIAIGYDEITGDTVSSEMYFTVDSMAKIILTNISDGYINWNEYQQDLLISGEVQMVEVNQEVRINFNGKNYYTNVMNDLSFSILIPNIDIRELRDNTGYIITANVIDIVGNEATISEDIFVDLVTPNPTININPEITPDDLNEVIQTDKYFYVDGIASGDARVDDKVIIYINGKPFTCKVFEDYSVPENISNDIQIDYSDLYYMVILYFNGIYRTNPEKIEELGVYKVLTDINFELNDYAMIINIKEFFTKEFIYFLKTPPGSLPFGNDFGTGLKRVIQTKNSIVRQLEIEGEINFFIQYFNNKYGDIVNIKTINIVDQQSDIGADNWIIEVYAMIKQERLIYRLEI